MKNSAKCQTRRQHGIMWQKLCFTDQTLRCSEKLETINHQHELHSKLCHHNFCHTKVILRPLRDLELKMVRAIAIAISTNPHILGCMALSSIIGSKSFEGHFMAFVWPSAENDLRHCDRHVNKRSYPRNPHPFHCLVRLNRKIIFATGDWTQDLSRAKRTF